MTRTPGTNFWSLYIYMLHMCKYMDIYTHKQNLQHVHQAWRLYFSLQNSGNYSKSPFGSVSPQKHCALRLPSTQPLLNLTKKNHQVPRTYSMMYPAREGEGQLVLQKAHRGSILDASNAWESETRPFEMSFPSSCKKWILCSPVMPLHRSEQQV